MTHATSGPKPAILAGLIGTGVGESLSPNMHMTEGSALGLNYVFRPIDLTALGLEVSQLGEILTWAERLGYNGVTITHPCKQEVLQYLDHIDPVAAALGAVNTVTFGPDGRTGYNTDTTGFEAAFRAEIPDAPLNNVVQLGAGGAGTAVADALVRLGAKTLTLVDIDDDRSGSMAQSLAERRNADVRSAPITELANLIGTADGVVHCTPQGMHDHPGTPFSVDLLRPDLWVADIVYRPLETELLREARARGCRTLAGGLMAVHQAVDGFRYLTGVSPDVDRMIAHFAELAREEEGR